MANKVGKSGAHVHFLIAGVAQGMAHEVYAELMQRNDWYSLWKAEFPDLNSKQLEERWVSRNWGKFIEGARATLAGMLAQPLDEVQKQDILDALIKDASLKKGRREGLRQLN